MVDIVWTTDVVIPESSRRQYGDGLIEYTAMRDVLTLAMVIEFSQKHGVPVDHVQITSQLDCSLYPEDGAMTEVTISWEKRWENILAAG